MKTTIRIMVVTSAMTALHALAQVPPPSSVDLTTLKPKSATSTSPTTGVVVGSTVIGSAAKPATPVAQKVVTTSQATSSGPVATITQQNNISQATQMVSNAPAATTAAPTTATNTTGVQKPSVSVLSKIDPSVAAQQQQTTTQQPASSSDLSIRIPGRR